jgi:DNA polymerase-3 subunit delta
MNAITFFNFLKRIKEKKESFPFNVIYGFNESLGEKVINSFVENFIEQKNDFNYRRHYFEPGKESIWQDIINDANSSSFFIQSRKIVIAVIRDVKNLKLNRMDKKILKKYLDKPNMNTILIVYISLDLLKDDYKQLIKRKNGKITDFLAELNSSYTIFVNLDRIFQGEVRDYMKNTLKDKGVSISQGAFEKIVEMKGDDLISIINEMSIFEIMAGEEKKIDSGDVETILYGVESHSIWDLAEAIEKEDAVKYLKTLKYLFINGIKPAFVIGTLVTYYNKIYTAKFLLKHNFPVSDIGRVLNQPTYFLDKFINSVRNFSEKRLQQILEIIYGLDYESKTCSEDFVQVSLQSFIFRIKLLNKS